MNVIPLTCSVLILDVDLIYHTARYWASLRFGKFGCLDSAYRFGTNLKYACDQRWPSTIVSMSTRVETHHPRESRGLRLDYRNTPEDLQEVAAHLLRIVQEKEDGATESEELFL